MSLSYPLSEIAIEQVKTRIIDALKGVYDPEIPVNIYDLGLIYNIFIDTQGSVKLEMTLTTPGCPVAQTFPSMVENVVNNVVGVTEATVELVWDPPWTTENMSEAAKLQLGIL
ncbi:MAG: SUF system Fe-S cluster assembly protein [Pseudomonadota bacterium]